MSKIELTTTTHRNFNDKQRLGISVWVGKYRVPLSGLMCWDFLFKSGKDELFAVSCTEQYDGFYEFYFDKMPDSFEITAENYLHKRQRI